MTTDLDTSVALRLCALLFDLAWKSLALVMGMGLVVCVFRRTSAARRHLILSATVYGLLALPLLTLMLPARHLAAPFAPFVQGLSQPVAPAIPLIPQAETRKEPVRLSTIAHAASRLAPTEVEGTRLESSRMWTGTVWPLRIIVLWGLGVGILLLRMLLGLMAARALIQRCDIVAEGLPATQAQRAQTALGMSRTPRLYLGNTTGAPTVPMATGLLRPVVLLPAAARDWPEDRLYAVLLHEMAHIKRGDWLTQMAGMLVCALYWFNPLVWVLAQRLRSESENACDDMALSAGVRATDYAQHLVTIAQALRGKKPASTLVTMARHTEMHARLRSILTTQSNRQTVTTRALLGTLLLTFATVVPLAVWQTHIEAQIAPPSASHIIPAPRTSSRPLAAIHGEATLPGDVHATLDSVSGPLANGKMGSWYPDGSHLTTYNFQDPTLHVGQRRISVQLKFPSRAAALRSNVTFGVQGARSYSVGWSMVMGADHKMKDYGMTSWADSFPATQRTVTMQLSVGGSTSRTLITGPVRRATSRHLDADETITLYRANPGTAQSEGHLIPIYQVKVTLPSRFVKDCNYGIAYLDSAGREHGFQHASWPLPDTTGKQTQLLFNFRASEFPVTKIKALRFASTPIYTAIFRNVALQPKVDTASVK
jgi:beta-lactamase regulating signal transducer with metallopeptidase domain